MRNYKFRATHAIKKFDPVYFTLEEVIRGKCVFSNPEHWIFDQYTGITDLHEEEIYENDTVRVYRAESFEDENGDESEEIKDEYFLCEQVVKWNNGYFCDEDTGEFCPPLGDDDAVKCELVKKSPK
jgi:hypothetical protein